MTQERMTDFITSKGYGIYFSHIRTGSRVTIWQKHNGEIVNERKFFDLDDAYNAVMVESEKVAA